MSTPESLLLSLRKRGVELWLEGGRLRYRAPTGTLSAGDLDDIRDQKDRVTELLSTIQTAERQVVSLVRRRVDTAVASFEQQRLWVIEQLGSGGPPYHIPGGVRLRGPLDCSALQAALDSMVERHETLRTVFASPDDSPVQVISDPRSFALQFTDLSVLDREEREAQVVHQTTDEVSGRFDLGAGPLIRGRLLRLDAEEHVLLVTMHHIVSDGWSMGIFIREVAQLYAAYREGRSSPLAPLPIQYADYAVWQREWLQGEALDSQLRYWKRHLDGAPTALELPTDWPRPAVQSFRGRSVGFALNPELSARLRRFAREHDATLFMTLYAGFAILLSRLSGQEDIVIGTPVANRQRTEVEGLIGFFVNTLALRVQLNDDPTVDVLLQRVRAMTLGAYGHQQVPFDRVVEELQPRRNLSHSPIFQTMLVLRNMPQSEAELSGLTLLPQEVDGSTAQYDLTLSVQDDGTRILGSFSYASDLFDQKTVARWAGHFERLLIGMMDAPSRKVGAIQLLEESERNRLLHDFNPVVEYASDGLIHELFKEQVERTPDAVALSFESQQLSYRELNERSNQLAHALRDCGVGPDGLVALCVERSLEMVIGVLGILKAGGAYVPLDPSYPRERVEYMLKDAAPAVVLTQESLKASLPETAAALITLDTQWSEIAKQPKRAVSVAETGLTAQHLAYVIYTSGSTGQPKGAMVEHGNLVRLFAATQERFEFGAQDVWSLFHSIAFDFSVWELWGALLYGGRVVVVPRETARSAPAFYRLLCDEGVTVLNQTPSAFRRLIDAQADGANGAHRLRVVVFGGEALELHCLEPWVKRNGAEQPRLVNMYGITETTVHVTYQELSAELIAAERSSVVGRPIGDLQVYVLDRHLEPVPLGVTGELYVGGAGVARGYLNRPDLTAERFLADPFSADPQARIYKSGDLGRLRADGTIEHWGRNDHQVKIRGFRIELGEIEAKLALHPQVKDAIVLAREDVPGERRLVAYLTHTATTHAPDVEELRSYLKPQLPEYMIPSAYVLMESLPLTANGKLDRKALPAPELDAYATKIYEAPRGEIEQALATIWQELLHLERVGRNDNFFELGGHSLLIVQLIERLRRQGLTAEVGSVFNSSSLSALASSLTKASDSEFRAPSNLIPEGCEAITAEMLPLIELTQDQIDRIVSVAPGGAANVQDIYPLAPLQEGILFHHVLNEQGDAYVLPSLIALDSREQLDALLSAIQAVIDRHDVLRTAILWRDLPRAVQVVYRHGQLSIERLALAANQDVLTQLRLRMAPGQLRIDLQSAPLIRVEIAQEKNDGRWYALLYYHHIISDHVALEQILQEVDAHLTGTSATLPMPIPYREYVAHALEKARTHDAAEFFRARLGDIDEPTAPFGLLDVQGDGSKIEESHQALDASLSRRIRRCAQQLNASAATLFHAAYALVIAHTSNREEVVFGSVLLGRLHGSSGVQQMLGMFINTLPLRLSLKGLSARQLIELTQNELAQLLDYEHASLAEAQRCSGIVSNAPLFTAVLNYRHSAPAKTAARPDDGELSGGIGVLGSYERTNYPFTVTVDDLGEGFAITAQIDRQIAPRRMIAYLQAAIESLVKALEERAHTPARALAILPSNERDQLLHEFNATTAAYPKDRLIHELFEEQVGRTPDAIAVVYESGQLTYQELNERSNRLAHYLRSQSLQSGECVAICMVRSAPMLVAQLAILKAGGTYVPIDPELPQERQKFMVGDCEARWVVATQPAAPWLPMATRWLDIGEAANAIEVAARTNPVRPAAKVPAYVMYTSGSTGEPKGVVVPHRAVIRLVINNGYAQIEPSDCVAHCSNPAFDASTLEIWGPLLNGARVLIVPPATVLDANAFAQLLARHEVTVLWLTVGLFNQYREALQSVFRGLKYLLVGGDVLDARIIREVLERSAPRYLLNGYGPTESTTFAATYRIESVEEGATSVPIGRPIANTQIYILDRSLQPVPIGVAGEIHIGGDGLALGYLNRPELTAERFIADPFSTDPQARLYKSGDLGRHRADGTIEFLGRNDTQVKIRGFRIELGEIEAKLTQHPQVKDAIVLAREDVLGEKRLVAYLTHIDKDTNTDAATAAALGSEELRNHLKPQLPEYMIPSAYVLLESLPLTANGKLDRKALPAPELGAYATRGYEAPQGEAEQALATIWQELLQVERIGRHDNFFELGGHSLLIVQLIERLRRQGLAAEVRNVFNSASLSALASSLSPEAIDTFQAPPNLIPANCTAITPAMLPLIELTQDQIDRIVSVVPGGAANLQDLYPLAPLQEGILFHHVLNEQGDAYVLPSLMALDSREQLDALLSAIQAVIDRHDVLRTAILWRDLPRAAQLVYRHGLLPVHELEFAAGTDVLAQLQERMAPGRLRIDLQSAPLIRAQIARATDGSQWYVLLYHHHIINDHVALEQILREVDAHLTGTSATLPTPIPYREYVAHALARAKTHDATAFFRSRLSDIDEPTAPFGLLDVQGDGSQIEEARQAVDAGLSKRIRRSAQRLNVSAATLFHSAYALVIAHTSNREEVVFGSVLLGRLQGLNQVERMLGMFINTLPVRVSLKGLSAQQLIEYTQGELAQLLEYEHASLAEAQRCSGIAGNAPLFTAVLNYRHSAPAADAQSSDASAARGLRSLASHERTNYPFMVAVDDLGDGFAITAQIDRQIAPQRVIAYLHTAIESLVQALEERAEVPARQLSILPSSEREQLLHQFNPTVEYSTSGLIHELFEVQAARTPDAIAVTFESQRLSYRELNERSNQLAHALRDCGVGPDELVALCVERSLEMVIGVLGILKAGGAYVPLDPAYPRERLEYMLKDAAPAVVLTQESLKASLPETVATLITLDTQWSEIAKHPKRPVSVAETGLTAQHLAYVIYTSGSTGQPKGAMVEHGNLVRLFAATQDRFEFGAEDVWSLFHSIAFDFSVWELWGALLYGGRVVVVPRETARSAPAFYRLLCEEGVTVLNQTPSAFRRLIAAQAEDPQGQHALKVVIFGGEALELHSLEPWVKRQGAQQPRLVNMYGITETTVHVTYQELSAELIGTEHSSVVGRPIGDLQVYVLDRYLEPVPLGVTGELYVGGAGVARGYLNRPELTAERFLADPFSTDPQARLYKSGDLGRLRADGTIEHWGRNDTQVKIRGFRIELGEIEAKLAEHLQVKDAIVLAREDVPGEKRLVAYLTHTDPAPDSEALRSYLKPQLPEYMIPSAYVLLDSLPLTANGKLDRKALPAPELGAYATKVYEAPQGEIEQALATIWQELLQVERVGRHDNFFELGGHSLLIVQLIERLRRRGLAAEVRSVFNSSSLSALASSLTKASGSAFQAPPNLIPEGCESITPAMLPLIELTQAQIDRIVTAVPGGVRNVQDLYPLAPLQEGILFHHVLNEQGDAYVLPSLMALDSRAQLDALLNAIQAVIDRHDVLRTAILWRDLPRAVQVVHRLGELSVERLELASDQDVLTQLRQRMAPGQLRIDLQSAPLIRVEVAPAADGSQWYALLYYHHIVSDHVALEQILQEVDAHLTGMGGTLSTPIPYREYVAHALARAKTHDATAFFRSRLSDIDEPTAPFGLLDVQGDGSQIEEARQAVDAGLSKRIRRSAQRLNVSAATLFHAAYALVIAHTSNREEVVFGSVLLGRLQGSSGVQQMLGMFINTLPVRVTLKDLSAQALIESLQGELAQLLDYEHASLAEAQRCSGIAGNAPLFTAVLNYRHSAPAKTAAGPDESKLSGGLSVVGGHERTNYPFTVSVDDLGEGFAITAQIDRQIAPQRVIAYLHTAIESLVQALEERAEVPARQLSILPSSERDQLLHQFNPTVEYTTAGLIHELFEAQAARTPDAIAVTFESQRLTYRELDERSNQLAHYLRDSGVGPDVLVALCVERSVEMVVGVLAILKAGGAYVPLDTAYPRERLEYMLKDASPAVVLTQESLKSSLPETAVMRIALDTQWSEIAKHPKRSVSVAETGLTAQHLAYVIYTSGSTGQPKGAMVEHAQVVRLFAATQERFEFGAQDVWSLFHSIAFDFSVWELWGALLYGGRVVVVPREIARSAPAFYRLVCEEGVTVLNQTPSAFRRLIAAQAEDPQEKKHALKVVIFGGEALELHSLAPWVKRNGVRQPRLVNMYGITETTVHVTYQELTAELIRSERSSVVGRPIGDLRVYVLDRHLQPVPLGVTGELYVGGAGVARGYLNRPELTAQRFLADPFSADPKARIYKSGDLGRLGADGTIEHRGRNDHQVKIRGFRIELGEIEAKLAEHPQVKDAVVLAREDAPGEKRLVAYLTHHEQKPDSEELRNYLKPQLPEYMVPSAYVLLESLPLTANGKLDRKALPAPERDAYATKFYEAPQSEIEAALATIWQELLQVERVGRHDNFFDLGGHSLLAVQLTNAIQSRLSETIPLLRVFASPILKDLAAHTQEAVAQTRRHREVRIDGEQAPASNAGYEEQLI